MQKLLIFGSLIFAFHVLSAITLITAEYVTHVNPEQLGYAWLKIFVGLRGGQFFAVALWALLTWRYWLPQPHRKPKETLP